MSTVIFLGEQGHYVSNRRFLTLLAFALQVARDAATTGGEALWVENLGEFEKQKFPGINFDLAERFPDLSEKKFWAQVFRDTARRIFLRQLGNHDITFWQASAISDAYLIAQMLINVVLQSEAGWQPDTEDSREAENFFRSEEISAE